MSPRLATFLIFLVNGAMIGTWIAHIPGIAGGLDASKTQVGVALLATSLGAVISMTLTGQLLTRVSSRRLVAVSALAFPLLAPLPLLAPTLPLLVVAMLGYGAVNGVLDVSMNAHGVALERARGRPIISSLHAGWSLGGLIAALGVAGGAMVGLDPVLEATAAGLVLLAVAAVAIPRLGTGSDGSPAGEGGGARISLPSRAVLPLGLLAVLVALIEGGIGDWVGLYLERDLGTDAGFAALGFAAFSLGVTAGRLTGDRLNRRFGAGRLIRAGLALVALALGVVLLTGHPAVALAGIAITGVGVANAVPLLFSAGGHIPPSGPSLAAVFTMAYTGFLAGPPIIGFIADAIGLPVTLGLLLLAAAVGALLAPRVPGIDAANQLPRGRGRPPDAAPVPAGR